MVKTITVEELKKKLAHNEITLIDVRQPEEYQESSIPGSHLIPLSEISLDKLPHESKPIVIHCHAGIRSEIACQRLLLEDPSLDVYNLTGGISAYLKSK